MIQSNAQTGNSTSIRRLIPNYSAQNREEKRHTKQLDASILQEIEQIVDDADLNVHTNMLNILGPNEPLNLQNIVAKNFANSPLLKEKCMNQVNSLKEILSDKQTRKLIIGKAKWNDTNKIPIHKIKFVENSKLELKMTKQEFIKRLNDFADGNESNFNIIPHLFTSDNDKHNNNNQVVKYLWIVTIYKTKDVSCDIAIGVRLTETIKKVKIVVPTGIYLYVENKQIMDKYALNLHDLKIGNIQMEAKKKQL